MNTSALLTDVSFSFEPEIQAQLLAAVERGDLTAGDCLAIRDLLDLAGTSDRQLAVLLMLMFMDLGDGSLCLQVNEATLDTKIKRLLGNVPKGMSRLIEHQLRVGAWSSLIGNDEADFQPLILTTSGSGCKLYFQRNLVNANTLEKELERLLAAEDVALVPDEQLNLVVFEVLESHPHELNSQQKIGLLLGMLRNFAVISGGPGTGKTAIIVTLLRCLVRCGVAIDDICLAAPTGRAAQRMSESVNRALPECIAGLDEGLREVKGQTIHSLLRYKPRDHRFTYGKDHRLPVRVIIVDEVSMVDVGLMADLLQAVADGAKLIFLGDKDQLPSIDAGAVLADLVPTDYTESYSEEFCAQAASIMPGLEIHQPAGSASRLTDRVVILRKSYRSEKSILSTAERINRMDSSVVDELPRIGLAAVTETMGQVEVGVHMIEMPVFRRELLERVLDTWAIEHYLATVGGRSWRGLINDGAAIDLARLPEVEEEGRAVLDELFRRIAQAQILTLVRHGHMGISGVNRHLDLQLRRAFDPDARGRVFAGAPIMIQRNDRSQDLYNGDVGVILRDSPGNYYAVFQRMGEYVAYAVDRLPDYDLAFAVTVHKSQGSEYGQVLMLLPQNQDNRLLTKEIIYTGLTRAKESVIVMGASRVLTKAIETRIERETGLTIWGELDIEPKKDDLSDLPLFGTDAGG